MTARRRAAGSASNAGSDRNRDGRPGGERAARQGGSEGLGPDPRGERLQKILARAGFGSRRSAEELIRDGRVQVDGRPAALGDRADPARARITVDGIPVPADPELRYLLLNKPAGVTTTLRDPHAERTVASLIPAGPRVYPVGRLDRETEGLLLLTNDGELAFRLQHPRFGVEREYVAEVSGPVPKSAVRRLATGVELDDGIARATRVGRIERGREASVVSVVMVEGRKREVRRMFQAIGHPLTRLVRVRFGPIRLGRLAPGSTRPLAPSEVRELYRATSLDRATRRASRRRERGASARRPRTGT